MRPEGWVNPWPTPENIEERIIYEQGADAVLEGLKKEGLYGEYLEDYIISVAVRPDDKDWAEDFLARIEQKGWLVFIPEE